ncbi:MAG TPA: dihydrodipicolinate synthase family protein, partial [Thermoplasmata archaeon]|nr:dihydrodipicolinate synthase family protein [Thermoplasmata archaeon]
DDAYALELRRRAPHLPILSGDDARTLPLMADPAIRADGVVSVVSNLAPTSVVELVRAARRGDWIGASRRAQALRPLFESVTLTVVERLDGGEEAVVRSRNPVPIKAALSLLGARVGRCRPPLGRLTPAGIRRLVSALESVWTLHPEVLTEFAEWLPCDVPERLADRTRWAELSYASC